MRLNRTLILGLLALALLVGLFATGNWPPAVQCERMAAAFQRQYYYNIVDGCWIQQANGSWVRVDQTVPQQP